MATKPVIPSMTPYEESVSELEPASFEILVTKTIGKVVVSESGKGDYAELAAMKMIVEEDVVGVFEFTVPDIRHYRIEVSELP